MSTIMDDKMEYFRLFVYVTDEDSYRRKHGSRRDLTEDEISRLPTKDFQCEGLNLMVLGAQASATKIVERGVVF
jgi:hypothetical protein